MKAIFLFVVILCQVSFAESNVTQMAEEVKATILELMSGEKSDENHSALEAQIVKRQAEKELQLKEEVEQKLKAKKIEEEKLKKEKLQNHLDNLNKKKDKVDKYLKKDNMWTNLYSNHETYKALSDELKILKREITLLKREVDPTEEDKKELEYAQGQVIVVKGKLAQLKEYKDNPFSELLNPPDVGAEPSVTNPIDIISALSFKKQLESVKEEYINRYKTLDEALQKLNQKDQILGELVLTTQRGVDYNSYVEELNINKHKLEDFNQTLEIFKTTVAAYKKKVSQINFNIDEGINSEIEKSVITGAIILFILMIFFFIKYIVKKYMSDNELFYGTNKVINFVFIALVFIILLFSYLENVGHLVTVLGFASAGIAIALKDWFMSIIGWIVVIVSGSVHVGDRVKFVKEGIEYVGDIVDISILRMTLHEDVTLTTTTTNRRAGRIIFIPNNYIFTDMIANYSHAGLKTVWDGIDFVITFDSNVSKAQSIAKDVTRKYSKGYTDMTRKQLNKLRSKYSMRNTAVEPRILSFFDPYGVRISAWYLTNAFATLTLRSTISMEILAQLNEADDIFLAYPSQSIYMDKPAAKFSSPKKEASTEENKVGLDSTKNNIKKNDINGWGAY